MALSAETRAQVRDIRAQARAVRDKVALAMAMLDAGDTLRAYAAAEEAQHAAFDMKDAIGRIERG